MTIKPPTRFLSATVKDWHNGDIAIALEDGKPASIPGSWVRDATLHEYTLPNATVVVEVVTDPKGVVVEPVEVRSVEWGCSLKATGADSAL